MILIQNSYFFYIRFLKSSSLYLQTKSYVAPDNFFVPHTQHNLLHSENLTAASVDLEGLEQGVDNTTQRIALATNALADLRLQAEELRDDAGDLKAKATKLQEGNVEGQCPF